MEPMVPLLLALLAAPLEYQVPAATTITPPEDRRLDRVAHWAASQDTIPNIVNLRWQLANQGVSLADITVYYRDGAASEQELLTELVAAMPSPVQPLYQARGQACRPLPEGQFHCVLIVGQSRLQHKSFPVTLPLSENLTLEALLPTGYAQATLWLVRPDGQTVKIHLRHKRPQEVIATLAATLPGQYLLELMASGPSGPRVMLNVPLFWGIAPTTALPDWLDTTPVSLSGATPEEELLSLVNRSRQQDRLPPLQMDKNLSLVARQRAMALAQTGELRHLNSQGSGPEILLRQQGLDFTTMAENIAHAGDILSGHLLLLTSPSHRLALLNPVFTHIGLGVAHRPGQQGSEIFIVEELAQLHQAVAPEEMSRKILHTIQQSRQEKGLPQLELKGALTALAQKEGRRIAGSGRPTLEAEKSGRYNLDYFLLNSEEEVLKSANILSPRKFIGLATYPAAREDEEGHYWVVIVYE